MDERLRVRAAGATLVVHVTGEGPPLLWVHGLLSTKELALDMLRHVRRRHRVAVFDQRGHGESTPSGDFSLDTLVADLAAVRHALGWRRARLGGESMGAAVVLAAVREAPSWVDGLVVDRPAIGETPRPELREDARLIADTGLTEWISSRLAALAPADRRRVEDRYVPSWRVQDAASIAAAYEALSTWRQPLDELEAVTAPAVVRGCADDPVHPLALARRMAHVLGAPLLESSRAESLDAGADARAVEMAVAAAAPPSYARS